MKSFFVALLLTVFSVAAFADVNKGKMLGSPNAPVKIEIYSDFECPACREFHENAIPQLMREFVIPGKVYVVSHEFPLNIPAHRFSREAAIYATAAARIGKYSAVADTLFAKQTVWGQSGKVWETVANVLTPEEQKKVQALAKDPSVVKEVEADVAGGMSSGINQTPTIFVSRGTQRYPLTSTNYSLLKSLINDLLK